MLSYSTFSLWLVCSSDADRHLWYFPIRCSCLCVMYIWQFNSSKKGRNCSNKHHRSHDCARGYCHLQMISSGSHICLTRDHVIESGVCIYLSPQVPYSRVFHDKMNGNHEAHSSMKGPKSDNDVVKLTVRWFIVHNSKGFPLLWLIKFYDWCDLMPCRRIVYELESIQWDMDWWHACIITLLIPLICYERSFSEF